MGDEAFVFEKDGIKITATDDYISFHKNGLRIDMPVEILEEFNRLLNVETDKILKGIKL